jgi:flotillin
MLEDYRQTKEADSTYYAKKKEAEAISALAAGYKDMAAALGGPQGVLQWMMLNTNTYEKLAATNAKAIQGLNPKITVWNTGAEASTADSGGAIRNLFQSLPPLLSTIQDQTGMKPPGWFAQMPEQDMVKAKTVNGV